MSDASAPETERDTPAVESGIGEEAEAWLGEQERHADDGLARFRMKIGGLHCSFCTATIRKALTRREGIDDASVSLAHEEGLVTYDPELIGPAQIVETLRDVGYEVRDPRKVRSFEDEEAELRRERDRFLGGLAASTLALLLMILSWTGNPLTFDLGGGALRRRAVDPARRGCDDNPGRRPPRAGDGLGLGAARDPQPARPA